LTKKILPFPSEKIKPLSLEALFKRFIKESPEKYKCTACGSKKIKKIACDDHGPLIFNLKTNEPDESIKFIYRVCGECGLITQFVLNFYEHQPLEQEIQAQISIVIMEEKENL
jgi:hypothetical protein